MIEFLIQSKRMLKGFFGIFGRPLFFFKVVLLALKPRLKQGSIRVGGISFSYPDAASFLFMYSEIFEKEIYRFSSSSNTPYIIDCGANIGISVLFFKKEYPQARVLAFEPDPEIHAFLKKNVAALGYEGIELVQKGVYDKDGSLSFESDGSDGGRVSSEGSGKIEVVSLKPYLTQPVDLLKLDIEGSEGIVLEDIKDALPLVRNLFVEYHSFQNGAQSLDRILAILTQAGFRYYIERVGVSSLHPFVKIASSHSMDLQLNIFAYRV